MLDCRRLMTLSAASFDFKDLIIQSRGSMSYALQEFTHIIFNLVLRLTQFFTNELSINYQVIVSVLDVHKSHQPACP